MSDRVATRECLFRHNSPRTYHRLCKCCKSSFSAMYSKWIIPLYGVARRLQTRFIYNVGVSWIIFQCDWFRLSWHQRFSRNSLPHTIISAITTMCTIFCMTRPGIEPATSSTGTYALHYMLSSNIVKHVLLSTTYLLLPKRLHNHAGKYQ